MALAEHYEPAGPLESLAWTTFSDERQIHDFARLYIKEEKYIRSRSRRYSGPTVNTVKLFVRSIYEPPRGAMGKIVKATLREIERQKALNAKRAQNRPYVWRPRRKSLRYNDLAKKFMTVWDKRYDGSLRAKDIDCAAIGRVGGTLVVVLRESWGCLPRVYLRSPNGLVKVVVMEKFQDVKCITSALTALAPIGVLRGVFAGHTIRLNVEGEGFDIDGELHPWRNVRCIYRGADEAHQTWAQPARQSDAPQ